MAGAAVAGGSDVETGAVEAVVVVAAAGAASVLSEASCSRAPSDLEPPSDAVGPGAGSGWLSTGATGAESGGPP